MAVRMTKMWSTPGGAIPSATGKATRWWWIRWASMIASGSTRTAIREPPKAHIIERFTRPELGKMVIDITIDDPGAYSKPWSVHEVAQLAPGWEIMENICNENQDEHGNNLDVQHLVGK